jgi:DNA-binding CsgD family transcriptional regulator
MLWSEPKTGGMIRLCSQMAPVETLPDQRIPAPARAAVLALDLIGFPSALLGLGARLIATNPRFDRLMPDVAKRWRGQLQLANPGADALLDDALVRLESDAGRQDVRSIPLPAAGMQPPMLVHVIGVRGAARDLFADAFAILAVAPAVSKEVPPALVLQELFNMTPAEARVARAAAQRQTIQGIATGLGLSPETVRTQLKAAPAKTGVVRNIDLAVMLAGACLPAHADAE